MRKVYELKRWKTSDRPTANSRVRRQSSSGTISASKAMPPYASAQASHGWP
jgi:hypothetical protein